MDIKECPFSKARTDLRRLRALQKEFQTHSAHFELLKNPSMYCDLATLTIQLYHKFQYSERLWYIGYFGITEKSHTDIRIMNSIKIHVLSIYSFIMNLIQFPTKFETIFFILPILLIQNYTKSNAKDPYLTLHCDETYMKEIVTINHVKFLCTITLICKMD